MTAKTVVKDGSSFAKRISCLKFEPRSRTSLVKVADWLLLRLLLWAVFYFITNKKTLRSSSSNGILYQDSITGKIETLGSIFSNETRKSEAVCVPSYYREYII